MDAVRFALDQDDFARLQKIVNKRVRKHVGGLSLPAFVQMLAWMFLTLPLFTVFRLWRNDPDATTPYLYVVASLVMSFLLASLVVPWASQRTLARFALSDRGTFFGEQCISLSAEGIALETSNGLSRMNWAGFIDRDEDEKNYYLFVDALQALVVPKAVSASLGADFECAFRGVEVAA